MRFVVYFVAIVSSADFCMTKPYGTVDRIKHVCSKLNMYVAN